MSAPGVEALLAALPQPAALLDGAGALVAANAGFRRGLGGVRPWLPGEALLARLPEAEAALAAALAGEAGRLRPPQGGVLTLRPAPPGVLLLWQPPGVEEAERLATLGRLAGGVAHDFNNLLGIILGAAVALRPLAPGEAAQEELAAIEAAAGRGAALVRQMLAFARQQVLAPRRVALNETVREALALLPRLLGPGIAIETALEEPARHVRVDPSEWSRVIINLAVNAREAMGGRGRLRLSTGRALLLGGEPEGQGLPPGRYVTLEVADDGPGIPPEIRERIFEPFFTTRLEQGGTGLGLATVQGIVGQFGGRISVRCPPEGGTVFRILLPRDEAAEAPAPPPAPAPPALDAPPPGPLLLVDDEPLLLRVAALALRQAGHEVIACAEADEALERLQEGLRPALLISDVAMPGLDGLGLARAARDVIPGLPVLLLSGYSAATAAGEPAREGFRFLAKPFAPEALCAAVAEALARR
jgi:two-component system cell cycle sensor histidine kinase/response regulator CckA